MENTFKFVLVGKSGNGKSATGNSILRQNAFARQSSSFSEVTRPSAGSSAFHGAHITVVDGLNFRKSKENADFSDVEQTLRLCNDNFSALLVVLKFGSRFGEEDVQVVKMAKTVFGENVLKDFGICLLTHGGNFRYAVEEEGEFLNVHEWFEQQTGKVRELFNECGKRCVLFDNTTKSAQVKDEQVENLLDIVRKMPRTYTSGDFKDAERSRKALVGSETFTEFKRKSEQLLGSVRRDLRASEDDGSNRATDFEVLLAKLEDEILLINKTFGENSRYSNELTIPLSAVAMEIKSKIRGNASVQELRRGEFRRGNTIVNDLSRGEFRGSNPDSTKKVTSNDVSHVVKRDEHRSLDTTTVLGEYKQLRQDMACFEKDVCQKLKLWIQELHRILWILPEGSDERKAVARDLKTDVLKLHKLNEIGGGNSKEIKSLLKKVEQDAENCQKNIQQRQTEVNKIESRQSTAPNEINLILIGKSGNGKSATGNSILGRRAFKTTSCTTSSSGPSRKESSLVQNMMVNVVDGPGVDTSQGRHMLQASLSDFKKALELCEYQFSALVIVLQYGVPVSSQEMETVKMLKGILGNDVIKAFGVCVMTRGDNFENDMEFEEPSLTFKAWCRQQTGELGILFEECNFRCVLFENKTTDQTVARQQVESLLSFVKPGGTYSKADFIKGVGGLKEYVWNTSLPELKEKSTQFLNDIRRRMTDNVRLSTLNNGDKVRDLEKMLVEIEEYTKMIQDFGRPVKELSKILQMLDVAATEIKTKLKKYSQDDDIRHRPDNAAGNRAKLQGDLFGRTSRHESNKENDNNQTVFGSKRYWGSSDTNTSPYSPHSVSGVKEPHRGWMSKTTLNSDTLKNPFAGEARHAHIEKGSNAIEEKWREIRNSFFK
ncbi:unnamed protein product [Lymnaea stagnalis]|uniref:AIG1-type G domain-containing protein n=1 Tax=Lymnaea stagnalis TaxID=6523 RepID=A0AAV2HLI6_LYMST